ncbi:unnamed protein product, partial [Polarella glacialis]
MVQVVVNVMPISDDAVPDLLEAEAGEDSSYHQVLLLSWEVIQRAQGTLLLGIIPDSLCSSLCHASAGPSSNLLGKEVSRHSQELLQALPALVQKPCSELDASSRCAVILTTSGSVAGVSVLVDHQAEEFVVSAPGHQELAGALGLAERLAKDDGDHGMVMLSTGPTSSCLFAIRWLRDGMAYAVGQMPPQETTIADRQEHDVQLPPSSSRFRIADADQFAACLTSGDQSLLIQALEAVDSDEILGPREDLTRQVIAHLNEGVAWPLRLAAMRALQRLKKSAGSFLAPLLLRLLAHPHADVQLLVARVLSNLPKDQ